MNLTPKDDSPAHFFKPVYDVMWGVQVLLAFVLAASVLVLGLVLNQARRPSVSPLPAAPLPLEAQAHNARCPLP